jgi:Tyosinase C-terminal domain
MRQGEAGAIVSNTTTITPILSDYVHKGHGELVLSSLGPEDVKPFLIKNLKWRVLKTPGPDEEVTELKPVPTDQIDGFKIHINSDVSYIEEGSYLPVPVGEGEDYDDIVGEIDNSM